MLSQTACHVLNRLTGSHLHKPLRNFHTVQARADILPAACIRLARVHPPHLRSQEGNPQDTSEEMANQHLNQKQ